MSWLTEYAVPLLAEHWSALALAATLSFFLAQTFIWVRGRMAPVFGDRNDSRARQCSHVGNPPRCGGLGILLAVTAALLVTELRQEPLVWLLLASVLPALVAGVAEDFGRKVRPRNRLIAAAFSAALAVALLDRWVPRADLPGLDFLMAYPVVAIGVSIFCSAGFCHALNLSDGMNGLAATIILSAATGLALIGLADGLLVLPLFAALLAAAALGFLALNWPLGRIFLGDAGSYGVGHLMIWTAFLLAWASGEIAIPALLLVLFWPFADTLHTIARRWMAGIPVAEPDRLHLHQILRRGLEITWLGTGNRRVSNPLTAALLAPLIVAPVALGVAFHDQAALCWLLLAGFGAAFVMLHALLIPLIRSNRGALRGLGPNLREALGRRGRGGGSGTYETP
ncbi:glycosyltransferase [Roseivivax sp. GX 12232]|uniref:MraY family glycosyltransferase n=1 Tax=Roseivivax sp. GX 12232 TaxID=2900547 RepID=UPI001E411C91|nr:glycosyltransferase [Roseivivax sp. GX 12232]MCE0506903.1 glycosyltransferase [Roseivivax sp. GX 12232]